VALLTLRDDYPLEQENSKTIKKHRLSRQKRRRVEALQDEARIQEEGAGDGGKGLHAALSLCSSALTVCQ